jgi:signal transduction histidine kinase
MRRRKIVSFEKWGEDKPLPLVLFEPFAPTRAGQHDGLSLAIAQAIIHNHGGKISASSDTMPLTSLSVRLPSRR